MDEIAIRIHIEPLEEGGYLATSQDVPGLVAEGRSIVEAVEIAQGLTRKIVESCLEHGDPVPPATRALYGKRSPRFYYPRGSSLMGRLAGFKYHEVTKKLRSLGWVFDRPGPGSHEVWRNQASGRKVTLASSRTRNGGGDFASTSTRGRNRCGDFSESIISIGCKCPLTNPNSAGIIQHPAVFYRLFWLGTVVLFLIEQFRWVQKGWPTLIAWASLGTALLVLLLWYFLAVRLNP